LISLLVKLPLRVRGPSAFRITGVKGGDGQLRGERRRQNLNRYGRRRWHSFCIVVERCFVVR
jgi:hypothetical protein